MVMRCSLLGHDYGEPDVEREREEQGSEVVVIVREFEQCRRCGDTHVLSETTEVTSLEAESSTESPDSADAPDSLEESESAIDADADGATDDDAELIDAESNGDTQSEPAPPDERSDDATDDDAATEDAATDGDDATEDAAADGDDDLEVPTDENGDPITDDAEILVDEGDTDVDRARGEWPDSEDVGPPVGGEKKPAAWPDETEDPSEVDDDPIEPTDDAVIVDSGNDGLEEYDVTDSGTGIASAQSAPTPSESAPADGVHTEFFCPRCSFAAPGDRGSLRRGDICPECRKGYLGERER